MERRGVERAPSRNAWLSVSQRHTSGDIYIYIYIYTCIDIYIYICIDIYAGIDHLQSNVINTFYEVRSSGT